MLWVYLIYALIFLILAVLSLFLVMGLTGAVYIPTKSAQLKEVFTKLYPISEQDVLVDLGAGDGVVLKAAVKHGAEAYGVELNPIMVGYTRRKLRHLPKVHVVQGNMYTYRLPEQTTVVYAYVDMFNIGRVYQRVCAESARLGRPLTFIANAFNPQTVEPEKRLGQYYLYRVDGKQKRA